LKPRESTSLKLVGSLTLALLLLLALGGCALPSAARRNAPFPWIVLSHGTAPTAAANRALGRYRPLAPVREWVQRGYAAVAPARSSPP